MELEFTPNWLLPKNSILGVSQLPLQSLIVFQNSFSVRHHALLGSCLLMHEKLCRVQLRILAVELPTHVHFVFRSILFAYLFGSWLVNIDRLRVTVSSRKRVIHFALYTCLISYDKKWDLMFLGLITFLLLENCVKINWLIDKHLGLLNSDFMKAIYREDY